MASTPSDFQDGGTGLFGRAGNAIAAESSQIHDADADSNRPSVGFDVGQYRDSARPDQMSLSSDLEKASIPSSRDESVFIDFDGPDDPANPRNWSQGKKWGTLMCVSAMTFLTPLTSSMFAPGVPEVLRDFDSHDDTLGSFVVSIFILGYAAGPILVAPLSEMFGRFWLHHATNVLFVIFTVACAVSSSLPMLIGFRFLSGLFGAACLTLGGGVIADMFVQEERGRAVAIWTMGPLLGPTLGPIAGGFIANSIGWRWIFWILAILAGLVTCLYGVVVCESYAPVIHEKKARRLRKATGGGLEHDGKYRVEGRSDESVGRRWARYIIRPLKLLVRSPIVSLISLYYAVCYGYLYLLFTTITDVFMNHYDFSAEVVGLTFIGLGIGMLVALAIIGSTSDRYLKKRAAGGKEMKPEYRLPFMVPGAVAMPVGLFIYGWTVQYHVFWLVPIMATGLVGFGFIGIFMAANTYLIDAYPVFAASATAANQILRSLLGALLPLAGPSMYAALGFGWGNSLLGFIAVVLLFIPFIFLRYGETLRKNPKFQVDL